MLRQCYFIYFSLFFVACACEVLCLCCEIIFSTIQKEEALMRQKVYKLEKKLAVLIMNHWRCESAISAWYNKTPARKSIDLIGFCCFSFAFLPPELCHFLSHSLSLSIPTTISHTTNTNFDEFWSGFSRDSYGIHYNWILFLIGSLFFSCTGFCLIRIIFFGFPHLLMLDFSSCFSKFNIASCSLRIPRWNVSNVLS